MILQSNFLYLLIQWLLEVLQDDASHRSLVRVRNCLIIRLRFSPFRKLLR